ncbi:MAG: hypothetical protein JJ855_11000 [Rhodospirillales bacterium]|nr:hypothetical protein [Rhodospirillales bacterium]
MTSRVSCVLFGISALFLTVGCVTIQNRSDANRKVPEYFSNRDYISRGVAASGTDIHQWAGRIGFSTNDTKYKFLNNPLIKNGQNVTVKAVASAYFFTTATDKNYTVNASFPFISADSTGKLSYEYEVRDVASVVVPINGEPTRNEVQAAAKSAGAPDNAAIWWVKSVALTHVRERSVANVGGGSKVSGTAFSINGTVYAGEAQASWTPLVSIHVKPMNAAADAVEDAKLAADNARLAAAAEEAVNGSMVILMGVSGSKTPSSIGLASPLLREHSSPMPSRLPRGEDGLVPLAD